MVKEFHILQKVLMVFLKNLEGLQNEGWHVVTHAGNQADFSWMATELEGIVGDTERLDAQNRLGRVMFRSHDTMSIVQGYAGGRRVFIS